MAVLISVIKTPYMRKVLLFIIFILVGIGAISQPTLADSQLKYPLKSIAYFCQEDIENPISSVNLLYDSSKRLVKIVSWGPWGKTSEVDYYYNELGQLDYQDYYTGNENLTLDRTKVFHYDANHRLIFEGFEDARGYSSGKEYTYNDMGQVITCKNINGDYYSTSTYEYDQLGHRIQDSKDTIFSKDSQNNLVKEIHSNNKTIEYVYDNEGFLIQIRENGNITEAYIYENGRLVEQWSSYFGIDPCFKPCCSQYVATYMYY